MNALDFAALVVIFLLIIAITAAIVALGSLPGKIAKKRGHPFPDAVNAASWIGLATGIFWPLAFIWAFMTGPGRQSSQLLAPPTADSDNTEIEALKQRLKALEEHNMKLQSQPIGD